MRARSPPPARPMRPSRTSARPSSIARPSSWPASSCATDCRCAPTSTSWATWPASPKEPEAVTGSFLAEPPASAQAQALYDDDLSGGGFVWNASRLWAHQPDSLGLLFTLMSRAFAPSGLRFRQRGILVLAAASTLGDSYCSLGWGQKLAKASDPALVAAVLTGSDDELTDQEKALAAWARKVAGDPNATTQA